MKRTCVLLLTSLILFGIFPTAAIACGGNCAGCCSATVQAKARVIVVRIDGKDLPHQAASFVARSVKHAVKLSSRLPHEINKQMRTGTDSAQTAFRAATGQTQSTFHRFSSEVAYLSLQFLHGAFSYLLALFSGLLR